MKIIKYKDIKSTCYNNTHINGVEARVIIGKKDGAENFCIRIFVFSPGGYTHMHSHDWEHEMFIHSGNGEIYNNNRWFAIKNGNAIFVQSNEEH